MNLFTRKYQIITLVGHVTFFLWIYFIGVKYLLTIPVSIIISNICFQLFIHRIETHKNFNIKNWIRKILMLGFSMLNLGSPAVFIATHVKHHKHSGKESDPHDPKRIGILNSLLSNWDEKFLPDRKTYKNALSDSIISWYHKYHIEIAIISSIFTPSLVVFGHWMSKLSVILYHINIGEGEEAKNIPWLKPLTWGEEMHYNHHNFPNIANHNHKNNIKEFDFLYYIGITLEKL